MSRMAKSTVLTVLLVPLALGGCNPKKATANPEDYYPLVQIALGSGETVAMIGRNEAIKAGNFPVCVTAETLITAFDIAGQVLGGKIAEKPVIPGFELDLAGCLALRKAQEETAPGSAPGTNEENASVMPTSVLVATYVSAPPPASDPSSPAASTEGDETSAPAPAPAPEEESPAPSTDTTEEAPEEAAAEAEIMTTKGNSDAAVLVEAIAGMALVPALHYAAKLKTVNCRKGTMALAAIHYVNSMIKPIADEIANPDGKLSVPAQPVDLSECKEG